MRGQAALATAAIGLGLGACGRVDFNEGAGTAVVDLHELQPVSMIALTEGSACAVRATADLWCWGANYVGELGIGDYNSRPLPVQVGEPGSWARVTMGMDHACAIDLTGRVFCWGTNSSAAELGVGDYEERLVPTRVPVPGTVVEVAAGAGTTQAVTSTGARWGWGDNRFDGAIGIGSDFGPVVSPVPGLGKDWARVTTGNDHACGIDRDGELWCWGSSSLGTGTNDSNFTPVRIAPGARWLDVAAAYHTCAIRGDGKLFCWGDNGRGALGDGTTTDALEPIAIATDQTWRAVAAALDVTCAIRDDDSLWCAGYNVGGQLGVGDRTDRHVLTEVMPGSRWLAVDISTYYGHACGIQTDDSVYCWGLGGDGQLGQGADLADHPTPVRVMFP